MTTAHSTAPRGAPVRRSRHRFTARRKPCLFCVNHIKNIDYKNVSIIQRYLTYQFKIESRRKSGVCSKHQRGLAIAIKRARHLALVPYSRSQTSGDLRLG